MTSASSTPLDEDIMPAVSQPKAQVYTETSLSTLNRVVYAITSSICSVIFLITIMLLAIIVNSPGWFKARPPPVAKPSFPVKNLKMSPDLNYYLDLLGLQGTEYSVLTPDGFVLSLTRILARGSSSSALALKPPVLLLHGLLQHSASYVTSGTKSIAYHLHQQGNDVWLGNCRCGFEPQHRFYSRSDPRMWAWDIHEMAMYDLPTLINLVLSHSRHAKVALVCYSQSTTQAFVALSQVSDTIPKAHRIHTKVSSLTALAPAMYAGPLVTEKRFIRFINAFPPWLYHFFFGVTSFIPLMAVLRRWFVRYPAYGWLGFQIVEFLFNWNDSLWDPMVRHQHLAFAPVCVSSQLMRWWLCNKEGDGTRSAGFMSNEGAVFPHQQRWLSQSIPPMLVVVGGEDRLVDGAKLVEHLQNFEEVDLEVITAERWTHLDVLWADNVVEVIGEQMLTFITRHHSQEEAPARP